jgi:hypothetical protein
MVSCYGLILVISTEACIDRLRLRTRNIRSARTGDRNMPGAFLTDLKVPRRSPFRNGPSRRIEALQITFRSGSPDKP